MENLGLPAAPLTRIEHANVNDVFLCPPDLVLRIASQVRPDDRLCREAELLRRLRGRLPVADVVTHGRFEGHEFQLLRRIAGEPLLFVWPGMSDAERDVSASRILDWLDIMRCETFGSFGRIGVPERQFAVWSGFYGSEIARLIDRLPDAVTAALSPDLLEDIVRFTVAHLATFDSGQPASLVHNDLWPANILAHDGVASHLLDFELAISGAAEADLFVLEYFCRKPEKFGHPGQFSDLWDRLLRQRPGLVAAPDIRRRFDVYDIRFTLAVWLRSGDLSPDVLATMRTDLEDIVGGNVDRRL
jgi:aminoglycoside phosphotransferase (APT) family kinase protein